VRGSVSTPVWMTRPVREHSIMSLSMVVSIADPKFP
jgi:hypothetical protein